MKIEANRSIVFNRGKEEIFNHIKNYNCDLIVMGSSGTKGLKEKVIGSNAQQILRNAKVPVVIVKKRIVKPIKNMLFVSDFKDVSISAFHIITHFANIVEAHIDLLFVNTPNHFVQSEETDTNMENILKYCNRSDICTKNIINADSIEKGINDFISENGTDLIAICTHGKSSIFQLFNPSIAETLTNHLDLPVLSVKI